MKNVFILLIFIVSLNSFSQNTYVPDDNFEQALIDLGYDSGPLNNFVPTANIENVTSLDVSGKNIFDLTGISGFSNLQSLSVYDNTLISLNLDQNPSLTNLSCYLNNISSLEVSQCVYLQLINADQNDLYVIDVSNNSALEILYLAGNHLNNIDLSNNTELLNLRINDAGGVYNNLTSLDLSNNILLQSLNCRNNNITSLDLSDQFNFLYLDCRGNQLTSLNLKNGNNTAQPDIYFKSSNNPDLTCIEVDDAVWSTNNWVTNVDPQQFFSNTCGMTYVPDDNFEQALIDLGYDSGSLNNFVPTANIIGVVDLDVSNKNIEDLTGIHAFEALQTLNCENNLLQFIDVTQLTNLQYFYCSHNQIDTYINVSQNPDLKRFYCGFNELISVDVSQNPALQRLSCYVNQISSIDVSANPVLTSLKCQSNQLEVLNVKNGNNTNFTNFDASNNPLLTCIEVDDPFWSSANWTNIGSNATFSGHCVSGVPMTYVPDDNFEQTLINLGYDDVLDDYVLTDNINGVSDLDVGYHNISDLTGIEDFTSLISLGCNDNNITSLDLSNNVALVSLNCSSNDIGTIDLSANINLTNLDMRNCGLTELDLTNNTALEVLSVGMFFATTGVYLTELDLSNNPLIEELDCERNNLEALDVTNLTQLTSLNCGSNFLSTIDLSNNLALEHLNIDRNSLEILDVSANIALTQLDCSWNNLTSLNLKNGNNSMITDFFSFYNSNLYCIEVDDPVWSTANWSSWSHVEPIVEFSEDCGNSDPHVLRLELKTFLEGPYDETNQLMNDNLRANEVIPLEEPYTVMGYTQVNGGGGEFTDEDNLYDDYQEYSYVDWALIELRDGDNPETVLATRSGLLQRNGDVENQSTIPFTHINASSVIITIRHRNHYSVSSLPIDFTTNGQVIAIDFSDPNVPIYGGNLAMKTINGVRVMMAGDANGDGAINPVDKNNYWRLENGEAYDYFNSQADFNMDGVVNPVDKNNYWRTNNGTIEQLPN